MKRNIISAIKKGLASLLAASAITAAFPAVQASAGYADTKTAEPMSVSEVEDRLAATLSDKTHGLGCKINIPGGGCAVYASAVFRHLFGIDPKTHVGPTVEPARVNSCYFGSLDDPELIYNVASSGFGAGTADSALAQAMPGDAVQSLTAKGICHSMIVYSVSPADKTITILDCNYHMDNVVRLRENISFADFGASNPKFKLYRYSRYPDGASDPSLDTSEVLRKFDTILKDDIYGLNRKYGENSSFLYAVRVFARLFSVGSSYTFGTDGLALVCRESENVIKEVSSYSKSPGKKQDISPSLTQLRPGDIVRAIKSSGDSFTFVVYSVSPASRKIKIVGSGLKGDDTVRMTEYTYTSFAGNFKRFKAYRSCDYPKKTESSAPYTSYIDYSGSTDRLIAAVFQQNNEPDIKYVLIKSPDPTTVIRYTTDGSRPDKKSASATGSVTVRVAKSCIVKACEEKNGKLSKTVQTTVCSKFIFGDADGNGIVSRSDIDAVNRYSSGSLSCICGYNADVNGDGKADSTDASLIRRKLSGTLLVYPAENPPSVTVSSGNGCTKVQISSSVPAAGIKYSTDGGTTWQSFINGGTLEFRNAVTLSAYSFMYGRASNIVTKSVTIVG